MSIVIAPIAATTSLSILLHGTVVVALLALHSQTNLNEAVGKSIEIELVSSFVIADQHETDMSRAAHDRGKDCQNAPGEKGPCKQSPC